MRVCCAACRPEDLEAGIEEATPRLDEAEGAAADEIGAAYGTPQDAAEEAYWEEYRNHIVKLCAHDTVHAKTWLF